MLLCNCLSEACSCWIWFWHDSKVSSSFPLHSLLISNWSCANENWLQVIFHVTIGSLLTWSWLISSSWSQATNTAGFSLVFKEWISNSSSLIASSCCSRSASSWSLMQAIYWKSIIVHFIIGIGGFFFAFWLFLSQWDSFVTSFRQCHLDFYNCSVSCYSVILFQSLRDFSDALKIHSNLLISDSFHKLLKFTKNPLQFMESFLDSFQVHLGPVFYETIL